MVANPPVRMRLPPGRGPFRSSERRHLAWENGAILPLARKRLTPEDLRTLGQKMAALRGIQMNPSSCHLNRDYG